MIAALIIILIISSGGSDSLRFFDPADAKKKIVNAVEDPARSQAVALEVDQQIAVYRQKGAEVAQSEKILADLLVLPGTTRAEFQAKLDSFNADLSKYDQKLLDERNAMRKLMTREEWDKAFGGTDKDE
jgi:hypothetical protein